MGLSEGDIWISRDYDFGTYTHTLLSLLLCIYVPDIKSIGYEKPMLFKVFMQESPSRMPQSHHLCSLQRNTLRNAHRLTRL